MEKSEKKNYLGICIVGGVLISILIAVVAKLDMATSLIVGTIISLAIGSWVQVKSNQKRANASHKTD
ncbi:hypothetical protein H1Z61_02070 [Bacillus aquiflavi]|uniref:Uncharacterized protein n=1 Tax=Bacillus aquiflavi TaxID=2672567 RepID=A0A6B3VVM0_9BACI|nr:hypothetical protein [Bacillus aquiflavi]MBA4535952.1 hypothetical protein [Bacillus aquiflavi]NEY80327.1 hypothetical protein [Bacillus aquiflavi]UAC49808.1 hypothetical protein K6959_08520 [Bacillus aquiflavi]